MQCGAPLKVIDDKGTLKCEFCNTVSFDNRHSFTHISHNFDAELEYKLKSAETQLENCYFDNAFLAYSNLIETFGRDYRVWQGLAASITKNFTDYEITDDYFEQAERYYETARSTVNFSDKCEFVTNYTEWREQTIARNKRIQAFADKMSFQHRVRNLVFFISIPIFLFVYWFVCSDIIVNCHPDYNPSADTTTTLFYMAIAPGIYATAFGIAALITRFPFSSICLSITTVGCVCIFFAAQGLLTNDMDKFNPLSFALTAVLMLIIYTVSTVIGRVTGYIAARISY